MKIELIIIASEILNGKILDLNTQWLGRFLLPQGLELTRVITISDDRDLMFKTFNDSYQNADIVITSGGLGPTKDDLTKDILANFFNDQLVFSELAKDIVTKNYARFNRPFDIEKSHYANVPSKAIIFNNPAGMAPGLAMLDQQKKKFFCCLPGVPHEFQEMFKQEIFPYLKKSLLPAPKFNKLVTVKTKMLPESKIFSEIAPNLWNDLEKYGPVSSLPHPLGVDIGVALQAESIEILTQKENEILSIVQKTALVSSIWHIGHLSLEELIIQEATAKNLTIATAESCTGGLVASRLTNISGSSKVFLGSVVAYDNELKKNFLGVQESTLKKHGAVSLETAKEMATGMQKQTQASLVVTTTGIAGPTGGTSEKPVGMVCVGIKAKGEAKAEIFQLAGDRIKLKERFSQIALYQLLDEIRAY